MSETVDLNEMLESLDKAILMIDMTQLAAACMEAVERAELLRSVAAGVPASTVYLRQRSRSLS